MNCAPQPKFLAAVAVLLLSVQSADAASGIEGFRPVRVELPEQGLGPCRVAGAPEGQPPPEVVVALMIDEHGAVSEILPSREMPAWLASLGECAVRQLKFSPEIIGGKSVVANVRLKITFSPGAGESGSFRVMDVGPLVSPVRLGANVTKTLERCMGQNVVYEGYSRLVVVLTIDASGRAIDIELPAGAPPLAANVATCFQQRGEFYPGTRDGVPVTSQVSVPLALHFGGVGKVAAPKPPSDAAELEEAYRACYPPDQLAMGSVTFNFEIRTDGSVRNAKMVRSSGDPLLDEAAACVLPRLKFTPMMRDKKPVTAKITWDLPVRPPR